MTRQEGCGSLRVDSHLVIHTIARVFFISTTGARTPAQATATSPASTRRRTERPSVPAMIAASAPIAAVSREAVCRRPIARRLTAARSSVPSARTRTTYPALRPRSTADSVVVGKDSPGQRDQAAVVTGALGSQGSACPLRARQSGRSRSCTVTYGEGAVKAQVSGAAGDR